MVNLWKLFFTSHLIFLVLQLTLMIDMLVFLTVKLKPTANHRTEQSTLNHTKYVYSKYPPLLDSSSS